MRAMKLMIICARGYIGSRLIGKRLVVTFDWGSLLYNLSIHRSAAHFNLPGDVLFWSSWTTS